MKQKPFLFFCILLTSLLISNSSVAFAEILPRFMLMIDEDNTGNGSTGDSERVLTQSIMKQLDAEVIDSQLIQSSINKSQAIQALSGNSQAAASIGLQAGADIILVGKAIAQHSGDGIKNTSLKSYQATINLKAIKTDTAEVIYTAHGSAVKIHVNDITGGSLALQAAAQQIANKILPKVLEKQKVDKASGKVKKVQLIVSNINEFWQVATVKKLLRNNVSGVQDVVQRSFVAGSAVFDIHFAGSTEQLAETLSTTKTDKARLKIQGLSSNKIDTIFIDKSAQQHVGAISNKATKRELSKSKAVTTASTHPDPITNKKNQSSGSIALTIVNKNEIQFGNYHALLIGNSKYEGIKSLNTPKSDVKAVAEILSSKYGFKTEFLLDVSRYEILSKLNELLTTLGRQDNLLIYYAGHGWLEEETNEGYWLPVDSEKDNPANWLSNNTITNILKLMEAKHVMIVSDSCYSGTLTRSIQVKLSRPSYIKKLAQKKARTVLASGGLEPVLDTGGDGNHSIFATAFIDALNENDASYIEASHLFTKIRQAVVVNSDQTPEYSDIRKAGHNGGEFIFKRSK